MEKPTVTVIIPSYNHAHFLQEALSSLVAQTFTDWEAIVVNNYSQDNTIDIVAAFGDERIRLENFHNNGVIAAARNVGLSLARGDFIAFLDSDDSWLPTKLETCLRAFTSEVDIVCHALQWFGERSGVLYCGPVERASFESLLLDGSCITPTAAIVRVEWMCKVGGFDEDASFVTAEDYHLWLKLARAGARMRFLTDVLGNYRVHSGNQSGAAVRHMQAVLSVVDSFFTQPSLRETLAPSRIRRRYCQVYYGAARGMQKSGQWSDAFRYLCKAMKCYPFYAKCYVALVFNFIFLIRLR